MSNLTSVRFSFLVRELEGCAWRADGLQAAREARGARRGDPRRPDAIFGRAPVRPEPAFMTKSPTELSANLRPAECRGCSPGYRGGDGVLGHAEERRDRPSIQRHQRSDPLGRCHRTRIHRSELAYRPPLSLGGHVRKGERGTTVVYADRFVPVEEKRRASETGDEAQAISFLKRFTVFSTDQCDDLPSEVATTAAPPARPDRAAARKAHQGNRHQLPDRRQQPPSMHQQKIMCRCRHRNPISSRSIGIERPCMSWRMPAAIRHASTVTCQAATAPRSTPSRNSLQRYRLLSVALRSGSCRRCGTPIISAPGLRCCERTIARLCELLHKPARLRIISLDSCRSPLAA